MGTTTFSEWQEQEREIDTVLDLCQRTALQDAHDVLKDSRNRDAIGILKALSSAYRAAQEVNSAWSSKSGRIITLLSMEIGLMHIVATALWACQKGIEDISEVDPWKAATIGWTDFTNACLTLEAFSNFGFVFNSCRLELFENENLPHPADQILCLAGNRSSSTSSINASHEPQKNKAKLVEWWCDKEAKNYAIDRACSKFKAAFLSLDDRSSSSFESLALSCVMEAMMECEKIWHEHIDRFNQKEIASRPDPSNGCIYLSRADSLKDVMESMQQPRNRFLFLHMLPTVSVAFWLAINDSSATECEELCTTYGHEWAEFVSACMAMQYYRCLNASLFGVHGCNGSYNKQLAEIIKTVGLNCLDW